MDKRFMKLFLRGPIEYKITFTTKCNANCVSCINNQISNQYQLDEDLFKSIIHQIVELTDKIPNKKITVSFYSIGESYLHPHFIEMCEWAIPILHRSKIRTCIVTNGISASRVPKGIDMYFISFNAGTPKTYESIYKVKFEKTYNNIMKLYNSGELKKAKNVQIHMLCFDENKGEEEQFKMLFGKLNGVRYRFGYKYNNIQNKGHSGVDRQYCGGRNRKPCDYVTNKVVIYPNGDVLLCCSDFFDTISYGNLNDDRLEKILSSKKRREEIKRHQNLQFEGMCSDCDYNTTNYDGYSDYEYGYFNIYENSIYQIIRKIKYIIKTLLKWEKSKEKYS